MASICNLILNGMQQKLNAFTAFLPHLKEEDSCGFSVGFPIRPVRPQGATRPVSVPSAMS